MIKKESLLNIFKKYFPYLVIVVATLLSCYIHFLPGLARGDDISFHISMINDVIYGIKNGFAPYSTNHLHMGGFALNNFAFYGPVTHYGAAIFTVMFSWMGATPITGIKFVVFISALLGTIYMYRLALKMSNQHYLVSLIAAVTFVLLPYRIFCALARCAYAETIAIGLIPMVFYGAYSFIHDNEYRVEPYVVFAVGAILIVLSHAFTALTVAIFGVLYVLFNIKGLIKRFKDKTAVISLVSSIVIISMCVMFYLLNAYHFESSEIYNISNAERQWTTYDHVSKETNRSYDFSGFLNLVIIRNWTGSETWDNETVSSLIFSTFLYFVSMIGAIVVDFSFRNLKKNIYYRHLCAAATAFILPLIFQVRVEIYLALALSLIVFFFITFMVKRLPVNNEEIQPLVKNVDLYFLALSLIICLVLLFVPEAWKFVPSIMYQAQFAWRMWGIVSFLFAMLVALLLSRFKTNNIVLITTSVLSVALLTLTMGTLEKRVYYDKQPDRIIYNAGYEYAINTKFSGAQNEMIPRVFYESEYSSSYPNSLYSTVRTRIYTQTNFFYTLEDYIKPAVLEGSGDVEITKYHSPNNTFHVNITSETALVQFPQFYYDTYTLKSNGKKIADVNNVDGLIAFYLHEGEYDITLDFKQSKGYQATIPLFYVGSFLLISGGVFGVIYRKKLMPKKEEEAQ